MADSNRNIMRESFLQEGVSCALATPHVIRAADLFCNLPAEERVRDQHNHGLSLLGMLEDQLTEIQPRVDAFDAPAT